jgi:hypothetical protein
MPKSDSVKYAHREKGDIMSQIVGLLVLGLIIGGFALLFFVLNCGQRVEINAEFARQREWRFQDVLPQFGRAQRQHILQGNSSDGLEWEMVIYLQQSTTTTVSTASTIWSTEQIRSEKGLVLVGPQLDKTFDALDLSHPLLNTVLKTMLGDEADQLPQLQRVPMIFPTALTVFAADIEYGKTIITPKILDCYQGWRHVYPGEKYFPILLLRNSSLQMKIRKALIKAAEVDAFVNFCVHLVPFIYV